MESFCFRMWFLNLEVVLKPALGLAHSLRSHVGHLQISLTQAYCWLLQSGELQARWKPGGCRVGRDGKKHQREQSGAQNPISPMSAHPFLKIWAEEEKAGKWMNNLRRDWQGGRQLATCPLPSTFLLPRAYSRSCQSISASPRRTDSVRGCQFCSSYSEAQICC